MSNAPRVSGVEQEVLRLLGTQTEMYGLEMVKASTKLKRGTIYVTLFRMEEKGLVSSRAEEGADRSGTPRRLYKITGLGQRSMYAVQVAAKAFAEFGAAPQGA